MTIEHRSFVAEAAIDRSLILMPGTVAGKLVKATGPTAKLLGTADTGVDVAANDMVDLELRPICTVKLGGNVAWMDPITSDANGKGVTAAPAAGANVRIIGYALTAGVLNDEIPYLRALSTLQG